MKKICSFVLLCLLLGVSNAAVAYETPDGKPYDYYDKDIDKIDYMVTKLIMLKPGKMEIEVREVKDGKLSNVVYDDVQYELSERSSIHGYNSMKTGFEVYNIPPNTFLDLGELQEKGSRIASVDSDPWFAKPEDRSKELRELGHGYDWHFTNGEAVFFGKHDVTSFTVWFRPM
jgi:hypothetical protein